VYTKKDKLVIIFMTVLFTNSLLAQVPPKYTSMGLVNLSFNVFSEKYLGDSPYFNYPVIAPAYVDKTKQVIEDRVEFYIDNITVDMGIFVPNSIENMLTDKIQKMIRAITGILMMLIGQQIIKILQ